MTSAQFAELQQNMSGFNGSQEFFALGFPCRNVYVTEGIKYFASHAQCWWLITDLACYLPTILKSNKPAYELLKDKQFWTLKTNADGSALLSCGDGNGPTKIITQKYDSTCFPPNVEVQIWLFRNSEKDFMVLLPSEY